MTLQFGKHDVELVQRDVPYSGIFTLARYHVRHKLFNGGWSETFIREILERYSAAGVIPYDPTLNRVILIEQFRAGCLASNNGPWMMEIPAGVLTDSYTYEQIAQSEAKEEAGCTITELHPILDYYVSPGGSNEHFALFIGKADLSHVSGVHGLKHEHEDIKVHNVTLDEALDKLYQGEIKTSPAIIALLWLQLNKNKIDQLWK
jgi:ADP-ribose pyrophosphatase